MTLYRVDGAQVLDAVTYAPLTGLIGQQVQIVFRDTTSPAPILDETSSPISGSMMTVNSFIAIPRFWIDTTTPADLYLDWLDLVSGARGTVNFEAVLRDSAQNAAASAATSAGAALASQVAAEAAASGGSGVTSWTSLTDKPDVFPPSGHTHTRAELSDVTTLARQFLGDADAQAMRTRIGAGTGNGTSNLVLGTTATTAAAGNHTHSQYVDSTQAATIADERIAAAGGGGGGAIMPWIYRSGAYPTLPSTAPAGVQLIEAVGPVQPSTLPSWVGNGPSQVPANYTYNGSLT